MRNCGETARNPVHGEGDRENLGDDFPAITAAAA
jgi:hypothetical protein